MKKISLDDGCNSELVKGAKFEGIFQMPMIKPPREFCTSTIMLPINLLSKSKDHSEIIVPYVFDSYFSDVLKNPEKYVEELRKFPAVVSLDNSVYPDAPLATQIWNVYRSRVIGYYLQSKGVNIVTNLRWGDERSYLTRVFLEAFAFAGAPKHSIVSIGTYGACQSREERYHLRNGLAAMIHTLEPSTVLVYGSMREEIFDDLRRYTTFIQYPDWISLRKRGA